MTKLWKENEKLQKDGKIDRENPLEEERPPELPAMLNSVHWKRMANAAKCKWSLTYVQQQHPAPNSKLASDLIMPPSRVQSEIRWVQCIVTAFSPNSATSCPVLWPSLFPPLPEASALVAVVGRLQAAGEKAPRSVERHFEH